MSIVGYLCGERDGSRIVPGLVYLNKKAFLNMRYTLPVLECMTGYPRGIAGDRMALVCQAEHLNRV